MQFRSRRFGLVWVSLLLSLSIFSTVDVQTQTATAESFADTAFKTVWQRTDQPVATGETVRSWLWGPTPGIALTEDYGTNGNKRLVQYFDKSRMEISNPAGDQSSQWYVTNGLLAKELVSGRMQIGDDTFLQREPARIPVAGDQDDPNSPTYADLAGVSTLAQGQNVKSSATGSFVNANLQRGQGVSTGNLGATYGVRYTNFDAQSGHNIAGPFWDFLNLSAPVFVNGQTVTGKLFDPTFFATGLPISEAYWVRARVGGVQKDVLVQVFERRVLTYTPSNEPAWRVEMGNIGQHYYHWRYETTEKPVPPSQQVYDTRFGMTVTGGNELSPALIDSYLNSLGGAASWYNFNYVPLNVSAEAVKNRVQLILSVANEDFSPGSSGEWRLTNLLKVAQPGSYWLINSEMNAGGANAMTPETYAVRYEAIKKIIRAKDPTAKMVGPNILNWNYTCDGCPGYDQGDGWTTRLINEYRRLYGHEIDFDVWAIHTYGLNWNKLPMANYQQDISQLIAFSDFLKSQPAQANKPVWLSEFGVIWGYDKLEWKQDSKGKWMAIPAGTYQKQALLDYINNYTDWLVNVGPQYRVEKWFLYASAGIPEPYTTTFSGINLFDGLTPGSKLTDFGQLYRDKAMQAGH